MSSDREKYWQQRIQGQADELARRMQAKYAVCVSFEPSSGENGELRIAAVCPSREDAIKLLREAADNLEHGADAPPAAEAPQ